MIELPLVVQMGIAESTESYGLTVNSNLEEIALTTDSKIVTSTYETYEGDYTVSATTEGNVVLNTENKVCTGNITVNQLTEMELNAPSISVDNDTGRVTALVTYTPGYNDMYVAMPVVKPLPAHAGATFIASPVERVILPKGTFLTGDIKVAANLYTGAVEFTPTDEVQTIQIKSRMATENITINPVPSNYGKIEWNGSFLTVS